VLAVSDGVQARVGTLTAGREWFKPRRTIAGEELAGTRPDAARERARPAPRARQARPAQHGYPPDKQEKATQTVLEQAALLSAEWAVA
jgi:type I restriction enzyme R subunit